MSAGKILRAYEMLEEVVILTLNTIVMAEDDPLRKALESALKESREEMK